MDLTQKRRLVKALASILLCLSLLVWNQSASALENGLSAPYPAPALQGIQGWLNSSPMNLKQLRGKVVLIEFWSYSCRSCLQSVSRVSALYQKYGREGLVVIGVHAPGYQPDYSEEKVRETVSEYNIPYPVALDDNNSSWYNYNNTAYPTTYLIDKKGNIVYSHVGADYSTTEDNIRMLLSDAS